MKEGTVYMDNSNNTATKQVKDDIVEVENNIADKAENTLDKVKQQVQVRAEQIGETASNYKGKVSDNLAGAADKVHEKSDTAQGFLSDKADVINEYAHHTIEKANQIGHKAADVLANSSDYVKNFDIAETRQQVKATIKDKPELSIAIAGIFGLLIGLLIGRKK